MFRRGINFENRRKEIVAAAFAANRGELGNQMQTADLWDSPEMFYRKALEAGLVEQAEVDAAKVHYGPTWTTVVYGS